MATPAKLSEVKVDLRPFQKAIKDLQKNVPFDARTIVRNEARLLVEELVDRTKPKVGKLKKRIDRTIRRGFTTNRRGLTQIPLQIYYQVRARRFPENPTVIEAKALRAFIKKQQSHIGWFASGWLGSGNPLGAKRGVPSYVKQHKGQGTTAINDTLFTFAITVLNKSKFMSKIPDMQRRVIQILNAALKTRVFKIQKNIRDFITKGIKRYKPK